MEAGSKIVNPKNGFAKAEKKLRARGPLWAQKNPRRDSYYPDYRRDVGGLLLPMAFLS
ncbi:hypothetical protein V8E54_000620 [Elaphomyces granulatus]